jgi:MFS transporter, ACS family, allantoate permease
MSGIEKTDAQLGADIEKRVPSNGEGDATILKHADKNDADDAYKLFIEQGGESIVITPEEERKLLRKIDLNLMPLLCIVYGLNYLDKTTLSYASVMGMKVSHRSNHQVHTPANQLLSTD